MAGPLATEDELLKRLEALDVALLSPQSLQVQDVFRCLVGHDDGGKFL